MIATFANGHSIEADILIGADGIHSRVREQFLNDGRSGRSRLHRLAWNLCDYSDLDSTSNSNRVSRAREALRPWSSRAGDSAGGPQPMLRYSDELPHLFDGWHRPVLELIEATPRASILKTTASRSASQQDLGPRSNDYAGRRNSSNNTQPRPGRLLSNGRRDGVGEVS